VASADGSGGEVVVVAMRSCLQVGERRGLQDSAGAGEAHRCHIGRFRVVTLLTTADDRM
jgi:hypothetical protein